MKLNIRQSGRNKQTDGHRQLPNDSAVFITIIIISNAC